MTEEELADDGAIDALDRLANTADSSATELREVQRDLTIMKEERRRGRTWRQIMSTSAASHALAHVARIAADLSAAGGAFRRATAKALRSEGMQVAAIADLFHVSRQRVTTLIRPDRRSEMQSR
jgi:hypothetical protein